MRGMQLALISDIHGNTVALDAVIADMGSVDMVVCLGDIAAGGPDPGGAVDRIADLAAVSVQGNTDAGLVDLPDWWRDPVSKGLPEDAVPGSRSACGANNGCRRSRSVTWRVFRSRLRCQSAMWGCLRSTDPRSRQTTSSRPRLRQVSLKRCSAEKPTPGLRAGIPMWRCSVATATRWSSTRAASGCHSWSTALPAGLPYCRMLHMQRFPSATGPSTSSSDTCPSTRLCLPDRASGPTCHTLIGGWVCAGRDDVAVVATGDRSTTSCGPGRAAAPTLCGRPELRRHLRLGGCVRRQVHESVQRVAKTIQPDRHAKRMGLARICTVEST